MNRPQVVLYGQVSVDGRLTLAPGVLLALYRDFLPAAVVNRPGQRGWFTMVDSRGRVRWVYKEWPGEEWAGWHLSSFSLP